MRQSSSQAIDWARLHSFVWGSWQRKRMRGSPSIEVEAQASAGLIPGSAAIRTARNAVLIEELAAHVHCASSQQTRRARE